MGCINAYLFNIVCVINENASKMEPLISLKMSRQFSFKNRFVVSPSASLPLNKLLKCVCILQKKYEVKIRIYSFNRISMIFYFWILKVIRKSSVYKCTFPFFSLVLPVNLTWSSGLSRVKLLIPCPWIGNINTKANRMKYHYSLTSD